MATPMSAIMHFKCTIASNIFDRDPHIRDIHVLFLSGGGRCSADHAAATKKGALQAAGSLFLSRIKMERAMGIEPTTFSLGSI